MGEEYHPGESTRLAYFFERGGMMSKSKIRRKAKPESDTRIMANEHPDIYGFPLRMVADELFCSKCENGFMRPSTSKIQAPIMEVNGQKGPETILHICSNEDCGNTVPIPFPPFPRVHPVGEVEPTSDDVLGFVKMVRRNRLEAMQKQQDAQTLADIERETDNEQL